MNNYTKSKLETYNQAFLDAKKMLNEKQQKAVDNIYGPVMTVAGPGTGKTQLLAVRIGNILQKTDIGIGNILCLTYTDAGSMAMRNRLMSFIGPEAYNAKIFTFHSFCNYIIQDNIEYFGGYNNLQLITDLELVDVYREIIDGFGNNHPLKRLKGNIYFDKGRIQNLFNIMKKEGWSAEYIEEKVNGLRDYYNKTDEVGDYVNPKYLCKAKQTGKLTGKVYSKGEINQDKVEIEIQSYDGLIAAARELKTYNDILRRLERYDYHDMILWVIEAFKEYPDLLASYQERFQFMLVDEYQDTNGAQNELLFLLADNPIDDKPNVFIVGDDDQSIYRFQGANMNNIIDFADKYDPLEIVLDNNYRSHPSILQKAQLLIENNDERLVNMRDHLTKHLIASRNESGRIGQSPEIFRYKNTTQEEIGIINDILAKRDAGVALRDIAVLYRQHKNVENIIKYLTIHDIPLNIKRKVNVLKEVEVLRLLKILKYIIAEFDKPFSGDHLIFEIMHFDYFNIKPRDIALISLYCSNKTDKIEDDQRWRSVIGNVSSLKAAGIEDVTAIIDFSNIIEEWIRLIPNSTAQVLFEKILTQGGILNHILTSPEKVWRLQLVNSFFNFIKDQSAKIVNIDMKQIVDMVEKMEENKIEYPLYRIIYSEEGVNFITAHSAKGLEFKHVYIIKCDNSVWVQKNFSRGSFKYPPTLVPATEQSDVEDDRRLFYVAMTRAEDRLIISYSDFNESEKAIEPARFIEEIKESDKEIIQQDIDNETVIEYSATLLKAIESKATLIDHNLIDAVLQNFKMSATSLNKYLKCPITFYYENILRVPMARIAANGFGNAVHYALEQFFISKEARPDRSLPPLEDLITFFEKGMRRFHSHFTRKEYELSTIRGHQLLEAYYEAHHQRWMLPRGFETEFNIKTEAAGVPISGMIDRIDVYDDHLHIIDYKTGQYKAAKLKGPTGPEDIGGDFWRQMVFYQLLLFGDDRLTKPMRKGTMDYVEQTKEGQFKSRDFEIADFEIDIVKEQLVDSYAKIQKHEFSQGCGEEDCYWCSFVNMYHE